jgi:secreted trypsin-like serine protease
VNGIDITQASLIPHQILIEGRSPGLSEDGGGSIIAKRWILTAAHLKLDTYTKFHAGVLTRTSLSAGQQKSLDREIEHPDYSGDPKYNHDLALVKVNSDFSFNGNVEMIKLASSANSNLWTPKMGSILGARPYVSGFGHTVSGGFCIKHFKKGCRRGDTCEQCK